MRHGWKQLGIVATGFVLLGLSGCATMQNIGNSLAFWKKSPPKDQFANNLKAPSASFSPTGTGSTNGLTNNRPNSMPFGNTGRPGANTMGTTTGNPSFGAPSSSANSMNRGSGLGNSTAMSGSGAGSMRSPYGGRMPGAASTTNSFSGSGNFAERPATHVAQNMGRSSTANGSFSPTNSKGSFSPKSGSFSSNPANSGTPSFGSPTRSGTSAPAPTSQFQNNSTGFQPSQPGTGSTTGFAPKSSMPPSSSGTYSPTNNHMSPQNPAEKNWNNYPSTDYPGFGSTSTQIPSKSPNTGFDSKNVPASANMSPPPSLPSTVFDKQGGYSPGSTGTSGKASRASFESNSGLYSPPTGSKIPSSSTGLYSPQ